LVTLSLVVLALMPSGGQVNRWFLLGPVAVQPSEFVKFSLVMAVAYYFRDGRRVGAVGPRTLVIPLLLVLGPFVLIVNQPDLGTALLLFLIFLPMVVLAGLRMRLLLMLVAAFVVGAVLIVASFQFGFYRMDSKVRETLRKERLATAPLEQLAAMDGRWFYTEEGMRQGVLETLGDDASPKVVRKAVEAGYHTYISLLLRPYQQRRLVTFVDPEQDPLGAGYHVIQSRVAVGSGRLTGKGYGQSTQGTLNFLPERHTDFIFAIFAEEWGFLGAFGLIGLYILLIWRCLSIIFQTHDRFSAFVTMGVVTIITTQMLINIGMAIGLLPVVGVPLPFFSYGGSSMMTLLMGIAILLNIRMRRFLWA